MLVQASVRVEEGSNPKVIINQLTPLEEAQAKTASLHPHPRAAGYRH